MTKKLLSILALLLLIWIPGMLAISVFASYLGCFFVIEGCYKSLEFVEVLSTVNVEGVVIKGVLIAIVFTLIVWAKIR
ncbi:hypothetical protein QS306_17115 [Paraburkholderia bonniea]|uniref:hypothetical protein n=1 Tax=Paraburkholderia bonniea TaxID=2152891 RepID=UPI00129135FD|nr:hypothetical protein [Paraburkholderia bonniea]WJF91790.1 hypothetical protein QS306_17115 [Paraburkholderia bonniea]WJF95110.1 hypothetical protein QS308_17120 [Paraburkholderia bonniea]